ncbi:MAG: dockerin type I domain-containing protein [Planctomycetota bacterium]
MHRFSPAFATASLVAASLGLGAQHASALDIAVFDAALFDTNGFAFGDFDPANVPGAVDTTGGVLSLNISTDFDAANGLFGGAGSDIVSMPNFDAATVQLEVALTVQPGNVADNLRIVLADSDGPGSGEEFQFFFDLSGVTPGVPTTLTQDLLSPGPVFSQPGFGLFPGDGVQNYGLTQIQIQSAFGETNPLIVDVASVKIVDPLDPTLIALTPATQAAAVNNFTFGSFSETGAVDTSNDTFVIDAEVAAGGDFPGTSFGGIGYTLDTPFDFDTPNAELVIDAKLLADNEATAFRILLGDSDGDDSGPGLGSDDFLFDVDTSLLNGVDFTEIVIPLGSGSESAIEQTFGFTNPGDGLQDFGLVSFQIQAISDSTVDRLNVEVASVSIRPLTATAVDGDANGDGNVDLLDFDILAGNFGVGPGAVGGETIGDFNGDGNVDLLDFDILAGNFGFTSSAAVPEPASIALLGLGGAALLRRRR